MDSIKDIIPRVIAPLAKGEASASDIAHEWQRLVEGHTSSIAAFKEGVLTVHVDCSARAFKMNLKKSEYIEAFKKKHIVIKNIRFKVGKI